MFKKNMTRFFRVSRTPLKLPRLSILRQQYEEIRRLARESDTETGGVLIGFQDGTDMVITKATEPGPKAVRTISNFLIDTEYCRRVLQEEYSLSGADYVGEWHSHVVPFDGLSGGDVSTIVGIMTDPEYHFHSFVVILALPSENVKAYTI